MSTHGVFVIKIDDIIWGFHMLSDGYNMTKFYEDNRDKTDVKQIFCNALLYFAEYEYADITYLNFYREQFNKNKYYADITEYTLYFDGKKWFNNWEE